MRLDMHHLLVNRASTSSYLPKVDIDSDRWYEQINGLLYLMRVQERLANGDILQVDKKQLRQLRDRIEELSWL